jgi:cellulose synthase/poly-beta-1,6-N-acetylglucosamine synthase-like glycosyltransferase
MIQEVEPWWILYFIDALLFTLVCITVAYMAFFSIAYMVSKPNKTKPTKHSNRFIVIIPAYKADEGIENTVKSILGQTYPQRNFDVTVVSDHEKEITNFRLAQYPITLLTPDFESSTKGKSLQLAINNLPQFKIYDLVLILDAGNIVEPEFLQQMNDAYETAGTKAIQAHRLSKNRDTPIANLDAIFEEINNSIFRRGHIRLGLSAAITGSGIAIDFNWFKQNIKNVKTGWEDKEIESKLMRDHIFVDYFDNIIVFDEKTRHSHDFNRQRSRWASTQFHSILANIQYLPGAIFNKQYDLIDKIMQWMLIPRTILMGIITMMSVILPFLYMSLAIKWWIIFAVLVFVFALATPDYLVDKNWDKSFLKAPFIMLSSMLGILKIARRKKHFEHHNKQR